MLCLASRELFDLRNSLSLGLVNLLWIPLLALLFSETNSSSSLNKMPIIISQKLRRQTE